MFPCWHPFLSLIYLETSDGSSGGMGRKKLIPLQYMFFYRVWSFFILCSFTGEFRVASGVDAYLSSHAPFDRELKGPCIHTLSRLVTRSYRYFRSNAMPNTSQIESQNVQRQWAARAKRLDHPLCYVNYFVDVELLDSTSRCLVKQTSPIKY